MLIFAKSALLAKFILLADYSHFFSQAFIRLHISISYQSDLLPFFQFGSLYLCLPFWSVDQVVYVGIFADLGFWPDDFLLPK